MLTTFFVSNSLIHITITSLKGHFPISHLLVLVLEPVPTFRLYNSKIIIFLE